MLSRSSMRDKRYMVVLVALFVFPGTILSESLRVLIPVEYSAISESRLQEGIEMADKFRREILRRGSSGHRQADSMARACQQFRDALRAARAGRVGLGRFRFSEKEFRRALEGAPRWKQWSRNFDSFQGHWYGKWDQMEVDHHWYPTHAFESPLTVAGFHEVRVLAGQFAWVGDGYGWNIIGSEGTKRDRAFILGTVYHVRNGDPLDVTLHRPHVGVSVGKQRLIWMTRAEIFFQERLPTKGDEGDRYAITGFRYRYSNGRLVNQGNAFQAVYTRQNDDRPEWKQFWVGISAN